VEAGERGGSGVKSDVGGEGEAIQGGRFPKDSGNANGSLGSTQG
jgi:hypothetical protein